MSSVPVSAGLDYHQPSIRVCAMDRSDKPVTGSSCDNAWQAFQELGSSGDTEAVLA